MQTPSPLNYRYILRFWYPLATTWIFMALEGPVVAAIIARMADPKFNLAAYGVAFACALIFEAPVIMLMATSTSLAKDQKSYKKLLSFTHMLVIAVTLLNILVLAPSVFAVLGSLMRLPPEVRSLAHQSMLLLLPWPIAIAYRRFFQGILINQGETKRIAYGTTIRLLTMASSAYGGAVFLPLPGASVGALALSLGVTLEALTVYQMTRPAIKYLHAKPWLQTEAPTLRLREIVQFYVPLALTSFIALAVQPLVTFLVGQCRAPLESLAVLPVVNGFLFVFRCVGLSYQEVAIALMGTQFEGYQKLRNFSYLLAGFFSGLLALIALTPLAYTWFEKGAGLSRELSLFSVIPLQVMIPMPALSVMSCWQRAMAIKMKRPSHIVLATMIEVGGITLVMALAIFFPLGTGVLAAALAVTLGRLGGCGYFWIRRGQLLPSTHEGEVAMNLSTRVT